MTNDRLLHLTGQSTQGVAVAYDRLLRLARLGDIEVARQGIQLANRLADWDFAMELVQAVIDNPVVIDIVINDLDWLTFGLLEKDGPRHRLIAFIKAHEEFRGC